MDQKIAATTSTRRRRKRQKPSFLHTLYNNNILYTSRILPYQTLIIYVRGGTTVIVFSVKNLKFVLHNAIATSDDNKEVPKVRFTDFLFRDIRRRICFFLQLQFISYMYYRISLLYDSFHFIKLIKYINNNKRILEILFFNDNEII